jgi:hypothetical protein
MYIYIEMKAREGCLNLGTKVLGYYIECHVGSVRIIIIKQITQVLSNPRDEFI